MEGIIKYKVDWDNSYNITEYEFAQINPFRDNAYMANYIGIGDDGIGFGNISNRIEGGYEFVISGSATGGKSTLSINDYSKVIDFNISKNYIKCIGGTIASSESLSHAAIYSANKNVGAIMHLHNSYLYHKYLHILPTTSPDAEYGTTKMANSILDLVTNKGVTEGVIIMAGHENGIIVYSMSLKGVFNILLNI
jgi:hypothetical protein